MKRRTATVLTGFFFTLALVGARAGEKPPKKLPDWDQAFTVDTEEGWAADGTRAGLVAHYYRDQDSWDGKWPQAKAGNRELPKKHTYSNYKYSRIEPLINHRFIKRGWFTIRWTGYLKTHSGHGKEKATAKATTYTFHLWADDGCRLSIDGKRVIDDWRPCAEDDPAAIRTATVKLTPGLHAIAVEYFQGESLTKQDKDPIKLYWSCPDRKLKKQIIPAAHFCHRRDSLPARKGQRD
ncbi:MAG: PA14 domain-containing protein [Planctomycetota bacterium]|jgi:hypothetical protein